MTQSPVNQEQRLLKFSALMGGLFAVLGVVWGLWIQSEVVLFDGIYSGMSILLSTLSILTLRIIHLGSDSPESLDGHDFHMGRTSLEPLIVALKSIVIIGVCVYGICSAVTHIIDVGDLPVVDNSKSGMAYATISILVCLLTWLYLKKAGADMPDLVQAESEQWLIDTVFSAMVLVSFILSYLISLSQFDAVVPYIDPGVVILASLYFVRVPVLRFIACMRELLLMAPPGELRHVLSERCERIAQQHGLDDVVVRSTKIGRELTIDVVFIMPKAKDTVSVAELDRIRDEVEQNLSTLGYQLWLNVVFTGNRHWA